MGKLTAQTIKTLTKPGMYADGDTLFFRIAPGGSRQWVQRSVIRRKRTNRGLGAYPLVTSGRGQREGLRESTDWHGKGKILVIVRKREQQPPTFGEAVEQVICTQSRAMERRRTDGGTMAEQYAGLRLPVDWNTSRCLTLSLGTS